MRVMNRRMILAAVMVVTLLAVVTGGSGFTGVTGASADTSDEQEFRWLAGTGEVDIQRHGS